METAPLILPQLPTFDGDASDPIVVGFLYGLAKLLQAKTCVEAGTYRGHSAVMLGQAVNPDGRVWTADVKDWGQAEVLKANGLEQVVACVLGDFSDMLRQYVQPGTVDLAFIDSGPAKDVVTYANIRPAHYEAVKPYMRKGGMIVVDDTNGEWNKNAILAEATFVFPGARGLSVHVCV